MNSFLTRLMRAYSRLITVEDVPFIQEMTKTIWEWGDYVPHLIEGWIQAKNSVLLGLFSDPQTPPASIVGFARMRILTPNLFWMEAGRIHPDFQRQGLGLQLVEECMAYARNHGAKVVQYDTWITRDHMEDSSFEQNNGSIALARHFGFQNKAYTNHLLGEVSKLPFLEKAASPSSHQIIPILPSAVRNHLDAVLSVVPPEIIHGWSYIPSSSDYLSKMPESILWYRFHDLVVQVISHSSDRDMENPEADEIWFCLFGNPSDALPFLINYCHWQLGDVKMDSIAALKSMVVFCDNETAAILQSYGFQYFGEYPSGVGLFEKKL